MLGRLHHLGFVVASIQQALPGFRSSLAARASTKVLYDPLQKVNVVFLRTNAADPVLIELVEPAGPDSPARRFLEKAGGLNHVCYLVQDLEKALTAMKARKGTVVSAPKPAVAFGGRRVAWVMTREWLLVELVGTRKPIAREISGRART